MELYVSFISYKCFNLSYFDNNLKYITLQRSIRYLLDKKEYKDFEKAGAHIDKCTDVSGKVAKWTAEIIIDELL